MLIREYLLGRLPEADQSAVEERLFADAEFFSLAEATEDDLMDAYTAGDLDPDERRRWDAYLAARPDSQRRLHISRGLRNRFQRRRRVRDWTGGLLAAAAAIAFGVYLNRQPESQAPPAPPVSVFAMSLQPGGVRSAGQKPQVISIPRDVNVIRITWMANGGASMVEVRHIDSGRIVWTGPIQAGFSDLPALILIAGDYVATARTAGGEETADYVFRIGSP